jgi:cytoskeleton protein RodZ
MDDEQDTFQTPSDGAKIGPLLEKTRKERGLSLEEVEHATKIRKRYLAGLEREDYGVLPDAVYARGFLKTYANYLGLDGEELSRELKDRRRPRRERGVTYGLPRTSDFDRPLINPGQLGKTGRGRRVSGTAVLALLVALLALAAVVGSLYYVGRGVQNSSPNPNPPSEEERAANGSKPEPNRGQAPQKSDAPREPRPDTLRVEVSVEGSPSWLSILTDGNLAYEQIAQPGFSQTFEARREISIKTGNAGAVGVEVNGHNLGKLGESGEVLTKEWTLKTAS